MTPTPQRNLTPSLLWTTTLPLLLLCLSLFLLSPPAHAAGTRIKDLVMITGARDNQLVGFGLVVGLQNSGDRNLDHTVQTIVNALQRFSVTIPPNASLRSIRNVAAVMVTADIPAFRKSGDRLDVLVSSMGDARSLQGGTLIQTPLYGADNKVYAVAQGPLSVGGFATGIPGLGGATVQKNHPTVGQITGGALVEREIPSQIIHDNSVELMLRDPDYTSAARMAFAINQVFTNSAAAVDPTAVRVRIPEGLSHAVVSFIARIESIEVFPDSPARVVINERTGTIVANSRIKISSCAVSHGNITIRIASTIGVSQPSALSPLGQTTLMPRTDTDVTEIQAPMVAFTDLPSIEKVAAALNSLGVTPRDMMSIFQAMKQAGALQAELVLR